MPIIKSAKKRVKVSRKAATRNRKTKTSLKGALKAFQASVTGKDKKKTSAAHAKAQSAVDRTAKKGLFHKNKAARKKRQLAAHAKAAAGVTKKAAPKAKAVKKVAPKKTATKKPAVKKAAPKKTAAKKPTAKKKTSKK